MKILHVISPLTKGGAERVTVELANAFARSGDDVVLLVSGPAEPELLQSEVDPAVELRFVTTRPMPKALVYLAAVRWLFANRSFVLGRDIVHCHLTFGSVMGALITGLRALSGGRGPKVVETYHAVGMAMSPAKRRLHMMLAARHDGLVSMADDAVMGTFRKQHPKVRFALIPNGISLDAPVPSDAQRMAVRRALAIPDAAPVVGTISRLIADRSPGRIVEIFADIRRNHPGAYFLMGGDGPELRRLKEFATELGLGERLILPGLVAQPVQAFSAMDVYVTLNVGETTGVAAMEAAAAGLPVVALQLDSDYGPGKADWIFSSSNPAQVAAEVSRLLGDSKARNVLAELQARYVNEHHSADRMVSSYREFYRALLALRSGQQHCQSAYDW